jgi:hypothetical protein
MSIVTPEETTSSLSPGVGPLQRGNYAVEQANPILSQFTLSHKL